MSACVSEDKYEQLNAAFSDAQAELEQKNKHVQELEIKLRYCRAASPVRRTGKESATAFHDFRAKQK
jgi:hypothetical protein